MSGEGFGSPDREPRSAIELPKRDRALMRGVVDMHVHCAPDLYERPYDEIELSRQARDVGYRALVLKSIYVPNADRVELVREVVPGIALYGGLVLNHSVGGVNVEAVATAIGFGAKVLWMPTVSAENHVRYFGVPTYPWLAERAGTVRGRKAPPGLRIVDDRGRLLPEVREILELARDHGLVVATGHVAADEIFQLLEAAGEIGLEKVVCTHVGWHATDWPLEDGKRMAGMGAFLEFTINPCMPARQQRNPKDFAAYIRAVGPERCIVSTDLGQYENAHPIEGLRMFIRILLNNGIDERGIDLLTRKNPSALLDLDAAVSP